MKNSFTFFLFCLFSIAVYAQDSCSCTRKNHFTPDERRGFYPFCKASRVMLVSFAGMPEYHNDSLAYYEQGLPININETDFSLLSEQVVLSGEQTDQLSSILYEYDFPDLSCNEFITFCYSPSHAILFLNEQGQMTAFIEICFLCEKTRSFPKIVMTGTFCAGKYTLLKDFFRSCGIQKWLDK